MTHHRPTTDPPPPTTVVDRLLAVSLVLTLSADANGISAAPREALTDEVRAVIREHKPVLLAALRHAACTGVPWHAGEATRLLASLTADLSAWAAVEVTAQAVAADLLQQAHLAVLARDLAVLTDVVATYQELHTAWCDRLWPAVPITTAAIAWASSRWDRDPLTLPMSTGSSKSWFADDEEAV